MAADLVLARTEDLSMEWESPTGDQQRMLTSLLQLMVCFSRLLCHAHSALARTDHLRTRCRAGMVMMTGL